MISSIFYFANTEQEYLDNFNNHQVKPYTIVFCKDTHTLWKDGIKYGGDTARTEALISDWVETNITPLIEQLQDAMDTANDAADEERERLSGLIDGINDQIKDEVENMLGDSEWIQENWPQGVTQWQSGWNEELESYLTTVGYWNVDPVTGEKTTKWSKLEQSVDSINSSVNRINNNIGTTELLLSSLKQLITDEGAARTDLENRWIQKESDTEKILKWMYSGLTTESGSDKTFADLKAAAQDGETTGISTIGAIVEKVPVIDPQTGDPQLDQDGNIVYQKDSNNNYIYRAKSTFSSALNDSLATMINESTENTATSLVITSVGDCIAALRNEVIDGRGAYASLGAKFAGMEAGLVAKADLNEAVAGLVIDGVRTVKLTVLDSLPSGASYFNTTQQLPSELDQHTKLRYTVSEFTALINTIFVHKQVAPDTWDDVPASYGADLTYDVHPGSYLKCSDDKYLYIEEISFKSSVFSEVDSKIGEAKSVLVARTDFNAASVVAMVNGAGSSVNIDANKINLNGQTTFLTAVGLSAVMQQLIADEVAATTITANTIDASSSYTVTGENDQSTTYTSHTIVDGNGVRVYNGENGHLYNELTDSSGTYTDTNGVIPNTMLNKSGEGWLANGNIAWDADGEASFTGGIDATSGEISGDLNVTGTLQLGASDTNHIKLGRNSYGGYITMYDSSSTSRLGINTTSGGPTIWVLNNSPFLSARLEPTKLHLRKAVSDTDNTTFMSQVDAGKIEAGELAGNTIQMGTQGDGSIILQASNLSGDSTWPEYSYLSDPTNLSKGSVQVMSLGSLKAIFDAPSVYSDRLSKLSVLVIRNNA